MKKSVFAVLGIASVFMACGDENTTNVYEQNAIMSLEKGAALPKCAEENDGTMTFVPDSATVYFCTAGEWISLNGKDGEKGDKGDKGDKGSNGTNGLNGANCDAVAAEGGFNIVCGGEVKGFVKNGDDGNDGKDGQSCTAKDTVSESGLAGMNIDCAGKRAGTLWNGKDGTEGDDGVSCDAFAAKGGYNIVCGGVVKGFIKNGVNGVDGVDGKDGVSCRVMSNTESSVTIGCGDDVVTLQLPIAQTIPYTTRCPAGKVCTYAPTELLDSSKTYGEFLDTRDYQMYKTIEICDGNNEKCQTWMAQNLNYRYVGVPYYFRGYNSDSTSWCYDDYLGNCATYGRLYTWAAAIDSVAIYNRNGDECGYGNDCENKYEGSRGVCPAGWHLPTNAEWQTLFTNVGGADVAGQKLKASVSLWTDYNGLGSGDSFGFSALPAGVREHFDVFEDEGVYTIFWSSTEYDGENANYWYTAYNRSNVIIRESYKSNGFSVRCLMDS